ncbi:folylpolyglutamate synthase/dihydrofolate synthase family protein [Paracoccus sp. MC1862]|uniref:bifunctional folylpolyglutamate synthase/dihydrofolate synthase n=1 Tax=Paracoccus sp. MC1862 TaxID=2760307 RepID=UPI0015FFAD7F|nr:folylpolyglutamate synthase/dihydrofolate synthase family protein [Paracoccus sp. MC1862]MBB1497407.1 bifunctional folylpolyglutamate synthase/dihydrofolate synthase [Paracoccus sp. MC1862]QQO45897.1 bifunctional folylpolyglutamate synthase/dihydrofolate synthase [Paracoccus sp. MC1862]
MSAATDAILQRLTALHPKVIDLSLDRIRQLLSDLGDPQDRIPPVIHVAGTNGKGSTQAFIRAGLEAAGLGVHAYTSPHLAYFNERIRLSGELIGDKMLADTLAEVERVNAGRPITFFEVTTAAAFLAFSRVPADYTLLEVGLGGRLDATNVVKAPLLTVITPISVDHTQYLGETLTQIAGEKAGILKRRVPCIVARQPDEALAVIEAAAARLGCPLSVAGQHWTVEREADALVYQDEHGLADVPLPALPGPHQIGNAGAAIAALRELGFGQAEAVAAMKEVEWPARMQRLTRGPLVRAAGSCELWLDGGHNPAGGEALAATLAAMPRKPTHLVCGMLNTKDVAGYMRPLAPQVESLTAVSIEGEPATLPARTTADMAESVGIPAATAPDVSAAVAGIVRQHPGARILICGSLYLAGRVLRENG